MLNNLGLMLSKRAHLSPDIEAFVDSKTGYRQSFSQLDCRSNQTANAFLAAGIGKRRACWFAINELNRVY
jgi:acyl-CoA synthetase (AMP-forming)/AMP-acid ligase II